MKAKFPLIFLRLSQIKRMKGEPKLGQEEQKETKKPESIRFVLDIGNVRSVIDSTLSKNAIKHIIMDEIEALFSGQPIAEMGESRFVGKAGEWHLHGRYLRSP